MTSLRSERQLRCLCDAGGAWLELPVELARRPLMLRKTLPGDNRMDGDHVYLDLENRDTEAFVHELMRTELTPKGYRIESETMFALAPVRDYLPYDHTALLHGLSLGLFKRQVVLADGSEGTILACCEATLTGGEKCRSLVVSRGEGKTAVGVPFNRAMQYLQAVKPRADQQAKAEVAPVRPVAPSPEPWEPPTP